MSVKVTIYGTEYPVKGDADPEYIRSVAAYLDGKMREVGKSLPLLTRADWRDSPSPGSLSQLNMSIVLIIE